MGIRGKIFGLAPVVIVIVDLAVGMFLEHELRGSLERDARVELTRHARTTRDLIEVAHPGTDVAAVDAIADRAGESTGARVTILAADGRVLGDSELSADEVRAMENHADRPEVQEALHDGMGTSQRHSATVDAAMLYIAVPVEDPGGPSLVRVAVPLRRIDAAVGRLRMAVAIAGLVGIGVAALVLVLISAFVSRTLRSVVEAVQAAAKPPDDAGRSSAEREVVPAGPAPGSVNALAGELERTLDMLAAERNRFEAVLQTMDGAVLALDRDRRVTTVNRAARQLLGLAEDVEGRTLLEAARIPGLKQLVEDTAAEGSKRAEFDILGGKRVQARATLQSDGGIVIVVLDVTEIRRLERVRRDFVANVSHELRTPISVIRANTETLLAGALEDPVRSRQFVEALLRHAERLGRLVSDLLDISRIEAGQYRLEPRAVPMADAVARVFETLEVPARDKRIKLLADVEPGLYLRADEKALDQILTNLVGNALKYTPAGGHVEVGAFESEGQVRVEVRDDGPGIDPRHRSRIFERFYRVDPGRSRDMGGTGLGLSIVKHLVEAMNGQVGLDPRSPQGSVFWFVLAPAERPAAPASLSITA